MTIRAQVEPLTIGPEEAEYICSVFALICGTDELLERFHPATRHQLFIERDRFEKYLKRPVTVRGVGVMGGWHRDNPELCGTDADPWMQHKAHRAAYEELRAAGLIHVEDDDSDEESTAHET